MPADLSEREYLMQLRDNVSLASRSSTGLASTWNNDIMTCLCRRDVVMFIHENVLSFGVCTCSTKEHRPVVIGNDDV